MQPGEKTMVTVTQDKITRRFDKELLTIEAWGKNSLRVRATQRSSFVDDEDLQALLPKEDVPGARRHRYRH